MTRSSSVAGISNKSARIIARTAGVRPREWGRASFRGDLRLRRRISELKQQCHEFERQRLLRQREVTLLVHDLRNPVSAISLRAALLLADQAISAADRESVTKIQMHARQLAGMTADLLDIGSHDAGKFAVKRAPVDVRSICDSVFAELELHARSRQVILETVLLALNLDADSCLLRRVLGNLVENAIAHAPPHTRVLVSTTVSSVGFQIRVQDEGRGVPAEMRDRVFEAFTQLDPPRRSGHGLGLAFCKLAVEAHGGQIWVEDAAPGAAFCIVLPQASQVRSAHRTAGRGR
ncbi:MAG: HAMP domain-containing sensor histidine kinase [Polyangiaceae bacterium]